MTHALLSLALLFFLAAGLVAFVAGVLAVTDRKDHDDE